MNLLAEMSWEETKEDEDIFRALYRHGFRRVQVVNGHGGNAPALSSALVQLADELPQLRAKVFQWWTDAEVDRVVTDALGPQEGSHASPGETSFMLAIRPSAVKVQRLKGRDARVQPSREILNWRTFAQEYPDGIMGLNPINATREVGEALLKKSAEICARELAEW